jgi:hypothetical protein
MEHNRSLKRLEKINQVINWSKVGEILLAHYTLSGPVVRAPTPILR